ncbi:MAG: molybdopterin-dependent oxidoreductase, partial [Sneathiella sp.]|nr:molybdopterin-dependent oxidoreductase [Sneathiella sp.]
QPKLAPACVTRVTEGMVVKTKTSLVEKTRESMLELLLANHPLDCPVCDKAGECELQDTVFAHGAGVSRFRDEKRVFRSRDISLNDVIIFNANRCIQCQRCVRMCEEVVGAVALGTMDRGMDSEITGFENSLKDCDQCGNCIEVCPVGALMSEPYRYNSRPWDLVETDTTCTFCGTGCQLSIGVRDGKLARVRSKYETGVNGETLCAKGRFGIDFIDAENRLETPMIRKNGELVSVSWSEALDLLARHMGPEPGNKNCGGLASATLGSETLYYFQKMMRTVFQTNSINSSNRWFSGIGEGQDFYNALPALFTEFYTRQPLEVVLDADCLLVVGTHVTDTNPVSEYLIRLSQRDKPGRLLMVSARPSRLDSVALSSLRLLPGGESAFFSSMEAALTDSATGKSNPYFDDFAAKTQKLLKTAQTVTLLIGSDLFRTPGAAGALQWLQTYIITLRSLGKKVALQFLFDRGNQMGAWEMGVLPHQYPGWHSIADTKNRSNFEDAWGLSLPTSPGKNTHEILAACAAGDMDMLYCLHSDPMSFFPNRSLAEKALSDVKMLVVQASHWAPVMEHADIVLPGASFAEESGTVLNNEGRLQRLRKIREPYNGSRRNLEILGQVVARFGKKIGPTDPSHIFSEITALVPSYREIEYENIGDEGPLTQSQTFSLSELSNQCSSRPPNDSFEKKNTFMLLTGECRFHSGGSSAYSKTLNKIEGAGYVEMNAQDAAERSIKEGEAIGIRTKSGEIHLAVRLNKNFAPSTLFIPENFVDLQLNQLCHEDDYPYPAEIIKNVGHTV